MQHTKCRRAVKLSVCRKDIDECRVGSYDCEPNSVCRNSIGDYYCTCRMGYRLADDRTRCTRDNDFIYNDLLQVPQFEKPPPVHIDWRAFRPIVNPLSFSIIAQIVVHAGWPKKTATSELSLICIENSSKRIHFFIKFEFKRGTRILAVGIKYSMRALLCDVSIFVSLVVLPMTNTSPQ